MILVGVASGEKRFLFFEKGDYQIMIALHFCVQWKIRSVHKEWADNELESIIMHLETSEYIDNLWGTQKLIDLIDYLAENASFCEEYIDIKNLCKSLRLMKKELSKEG